MRNDLTSRVFGRDVSLVDKLFWRSFLTLFFGLALGAVIVQILGFKIEPDSAQIQLSDKLISIFPLDYFSIRNKTGELNAKKLWLFEMHATMLFAGVCCYYFFGVTSLFARISSAWVALNFEPLVNRSNFAAIVIIIFFVTVFVSDFNQLLLNSRYSSLFGTFIGFVVWISSLTFLAFSMFCSLTFFIISVWNYLMGHSNQKQ